VRDERLSEVEGIGPEAVALGTFLAAAVYNGCVSCAIGLQVLCQFLGGRILGMQRIVTVVGGGLAGSEAAWQAARRGAQVILYEMRPKVQTGAHQTDKIGELVCSNSLGSKLPDRASGVLMEELRRLGSMLLECAEASAVPAGGALAVDRSVFADCIQDRIESEPFIEIRREEVRDIPQGAVILATGPLTSAAFSQAIATLTGQSHLYFYDALSPIVEADSINMGIAFRASRYDRGETRQGDYINCPMSKDEYDTFVKALLEADRISLRSFEQDIAAGVKAGAHEYFESCLPVEILAERGHDTLAFGPLRPVGLEDPRTGRRSHAVVQLRQDDLAGSLYNMVGFQTNLRFPEQRRVFRLIPGMGKAVFVRYGQMHRNTFINAPSLLDPTLQLRSDPRIFFAGQITGVEGYLGNIATGLLAGINSVRYLRGEACWRLPNESMLGALCHYISHADPSSFQPMKANFGLVPELDDGVRRNRRGRNRARSQRALQSLEDFLFRN
jgi:methylenetetrahydrofolate--tRNA-(uracil-5-)-methyltransferase